ncbi:hypothetical protein A0H81_06868 [Grifola frondosa]|uniref:Uncharacterized protein n=1 Tax=Grifola frondosa TaxID=5627 RepID=A0A1C7M7K4_GRIFR|nr:hypothetical protein A0H81_06868 [Grifola frondosa]
MPLSFLWEKFITWWNYHRLDDLVSAHLGLLEGTPVVNDEFLRHNAIMIGTVHIGIYTRLLLTFLMDKNARPTPKDMNLWVSVVRFLKRDARGGAQGFFTYMELRVALREAPDYE